MPQKLLVVVLAALVLAAGAWLAFGNGSAQHPAANAAANAATPGSAPAVAAAAAPPADQDAAAAAAQDENARTAVPSADSGGVASTVAVRGRLLDRQGRPRADVELRLSTWPGLDAIEELPPRPFDGDEPRDRLPKTRSSADGRFQFAVPKGRAGQVLAPASDLVFAKGEVHFGPARADVELGDLELLAASRVAGVVRDVRGQPVADVKVVAGIDALAFGLRSESRTDTAGAFEINGLHPGKWQLRTASGRFLPAVATVELQAEQQLRDVAITVEQGKAIAGQVVDDRGVPVADVKVGSNRKESRGEMALERFSPDEATTTDRNGYFTLANLQGDAALVRAFGKGYAPASEHNVAVGTGNLLLRLQRLGSIVGVLRDTDGRPLAGSRVSAGARGGGEELAILDGNSELPFGLGSATATTGAGGEFRIDGVRPGVVTVSARGKAHRPAKRTGVAVQPAQVVEGIALVAEVGAIARVHVLDDAGKPVAGARVAVTEPRQPTAPGGAVRRTMRVERDDSGGVQTFGDGPQQFGSGTTDAQGNVDVPGLPAGAATITASHETLADAQPVSVVLPSSGVVESKLVMRQPGFAAVTVTRADGTPAAAGLVVHGPVGMVEDERDRTAKAGADGLARVGPLPPGEYWAELQLEQAARNIGGAMLFMGGDNRRLGGTRVQFQVVAGRTIDVAMQLPVLTRVHGTVTGADGPVAGVAVELERAGDEAAAGGGGGGGDLPGGPLQARTAEDGTYAIDDVEAGRYRVRWGKPGQIVKATADLAVAANVPDLQRDLELRYGKLKVRAVDKATGDGVEGAEVELQAGATSGPRPRQRRVMMFSVSMNSDGGESTTMTMGGQRAKTDVDGVAEIADVPPGSYTVGIRDDRHAPASLADQVVSERTTTDCGRVELEAAGRIRGRVLDAEGKAAGMALVVYRKIGAAGDPEREPAMGGSFTLKGLSPGRYALKAQGLGPGEDVFGPEVEVEVGSGKTVGGVDLRLQPR